MKVYKNTKRPSGSQSETPTINITRKPKLTIHMGGYQKFTLTDNVVQPLKYTTKFQYLHRLLLVQRNNCESMADIGCSNGLVCFMAQQAGYTHVHALDHDKQCLAVINKAIQELDYSQIKTQQYSFGNDFEPVDLLVMGALIHWVYSCTALYGQFDKIISYLRSHANKLLVIEWVAPTDPAIRAFKHTQFNTGIIKEAYTESNFVKSLQKHFGKVEKVLNVTPTRILYLAYV